MAAVVSFAVLGCSAASTNPDWEPQIRSANDELLNQGNVATAREIFAPAYVAHLTTGDLRGGPEVIEEFVTSLRSAFPDLNVEVQVLATQGDRVAWVRTHRGTHRGAHPTLLGNLLKGAPG